MIFQFNPDLTYFCGWILVSDFSNQCGYGITQALLSRLYVRRGWTRYRRYKRIVQVNTYFIFSIAIHIRLDCLLIDAVNLFWLFMLYLETTAREIPFNVLRLLWEESSVFWCVRLFRLMFLVSYNHVSVFCFKFSFTLWQTARWIFGEVAIVGQNDGEAERARP